LRGNEVSHYHLSCWAAWSVIEQS